MLDNQSTLPATKKSNPSKESSYIKEIYVESKGRYYYSECQIQFKEKRKYKSGFFILKQWHHDRSFIICQKIKQTTIQIIVNSRNQQVQMGSIENIIVDKQRVFQFIYRSQNSKKMPRIKFSKAEALNEWKKIIDGLQQKLPVSWVNNKIKIKKNQKKQKQQANIEIRRTSHSQNDLKKQITKAEQSNKIKVQLVQQNNQINNPKHQYQEVRLQQYKSFNNNQSNSEYSHSKSLLKVKQQYEQKMESLKEVTNFIELSLKKQEQKNKELQLENYKLKQQINQNLREKMIVNDQLNLKIKYASDLQKKYENQRVINGKISMNIQQLQKKIKKLSHQIQSLKKQQKESQNFLCMDLQMKIQQKDEEISLLKEQIQHLNTRITELIDQHKLKQEEFASKMLRKQPLFMGSQILVNKDDYYHIFDGKILQNYIHHKQYLKEQMQAYTNMKILKTKIIYEFDSLNKANFHNYIDQVEDIMVIIKTSSGYLLGCYSNSPISPKKTAQSKGCLISISNRKLFPCGKGKKSVAYDDYYIIFGKAEIRMKFLQKKVFSNFGIGCCSYEYKDHKVDILLGQGPNRQVEIDHFQVHKIYFRQ